VRYVFDEIRARKLNVIPVTGLNRDVAYQEAVADAEDQDRRGICLRITTEDFEESDNIEGELSELLAKLQVTASETDLILDLGEIPATRTTFVVLATKSILRGLPFVMDWRTLTLAASAFPPSLSRLASAEVTTAQRGEWIVWEALSKTRTTVPRLPTFGDYAVSHAEFMEMDLAIERAHIDLRYTTDRSWLILKGRDVKRHGNHQFNDLCKILVSRSEYSGPTFSWGDAYVQACAANAASAVDAATWRMVGTTHHLAFVTGQLAGLRV
jgi:hypothetical protein